MLPGMVRPVFGTRLARARAKSLLDVWPPAKALAYVVDDAKSGLRQRLGRIQSESGSTPPRAGDRGVGGRTWRRCSATTVTYGGLGHLGGAAAEVGPGDNAGVALLLQVAGFETVELVDRFREPAEPGPATAYLPGVGPS